MKARIIATLIVLAALVSSITACTTTVSFLPNVMKLAPEDTYMITCMDTKEAVEDPEFDFIYDYMINELSYMMVGIEASDISASAIIETDRDYVYVVMGNIDLGEVRDALDDEDFVESEYQGIEIWTDDYDDAVAFIDNMIVVGYSDEVEACIRRHNSEESSMYDDKDIKAVADKLPAAVVHVVFGADVIYSFEVLAGGVYWRNSTSGDEVLDMSGWLRFDSVASAEAAMENIEDDLSWEFNAINIEAHLSGQFIEFTGEMEVQD
jgi:hypothetical protein